MAFWQVIEREGVSSSWSIPRSPDVVMRFATKESAVKAAKKYVSSVNVDNALASSEKEASAEMFLVDDNGCYLGELDGSDWYMRYKKDDYDPKDRTKVVHKIDEIVKDPTYFELDKKGEVSVREVPGT